jgi:predicted signal transduction protein with EAL and GGDEF domain
MGADVELISAEQARARRVRRATSRGTMSMRYAPYVRTRSRRVSARYISARWAGADIRPGDEVIAIKAVGGVDYVVTRPRRRLR